MTAWGATAVALKLKRPSLADTWLTLLVVQSLALLSHVPTCKHRGKCCSHGRRGDSEHFGNGQLQWWTCRGTCQVRLR